jgi:iron(III) transport system substrate-binding protein
MSWGKPAIVAAAVVLAACSGDDNAAIPSTSPVVATTSSPVASATSLPIDDTVSTTAPAAASTTPLGGDAEQRREELIAAAREEGALTLMIDNQGGPDQLDAWRDGFNAYYGLEHSLEHTPPPNGPELSGQLLQQLASGRAAGTDVDMGSVAHVITLLDGGALEPEDWSWAENVAPEFVESDGAVVKVSTRLPGITYNSSTVDAADVPETMEDLLALTEHYDVWGSPLASNFNYLATDALWGEATTRSYVEQFSAAVAGVDFCGSTQRMVNGEFDFYAIDCGVSEALSWQARGAPVGHVIPRDAALVTYFYMDVPTHAPHPASARLWINYMLSPEAQGILFDGDFLDLHLAEGSKMAPVVAEVEADVGSLTEIDVAFYRRHQDLLDPIGEELARIMRGEA